MTAFDLLAAATSGMSAGAPTRLDPVQLFMDADIVVKLVMAGLLLASLWTWTIIVAFWLRMGTLGRRTASYEADFWQAEDFDAFARQKGNGELPPGRIARAGVGEWRHSTKAGVKDREGTRQRLAAVMESQVAHEADELADRLNFLATVGSVAPFVGLFGTVWGIMNSFFQIGAQESSSLAVVAPGISEALFATAIGLFAAIPAVIAYNRFSHRVNRYESQLQRFADRLHASFSRQLEA